MYISVSTDAWLAGKVSCKKSAMLPNLSNTTKLNSDSSSSLNHSIGKNSLYTSLDALIFVTSLLLFQPYDRRYTTGLPIALAYAPIVCSKLYNWYSDVI